MWRASLSATGMFSKLVSPGQSSVPGSGGCGGDADGEHGQPLVVPGREVVGVEQDQEVRVHGLEMLAHHAE